MQTPQENVFPTWWSCVLCWINSSVSWYKRTQNSHLYGHSLACTTTCLASALIEEKATSHTLHANPLASSRWDGLCLFVRSCCFRCGGDPAATTLPPMYTGVDAPGGGLGKIGRRVDWAWACLITWAATRCGDICCCIAWEAGGEEACIAWEAGGEVACSGADGIGRLGWWVVRLDWLVFGSNGLYALGCIGIGNCILGCCIWLSLSATFMSNASFSCIIWWILFFLCSCFLITSCSFPPKDAGDMWWNSYLCAFSFA